MSTIPNGGPAFPVDTHFDQQGHQTGPTTYQFPGMTTRDYFAAKAIQGLLARQFTKDERDRPFVEWVVEFSFEIADAMLRAREAK